MAWHDQCPDRYSKGSVLLMTDKQFMWMTLGIWSCSFLGGFYFG